MKLSKNKKRNKIQRRIRKKISGTSSLPRLSVFRSNKEIYCQLVDDLNGQTLAFASSSEKAIKAEGSKSDVAKAVGKSMAERAKAINIDKVVFDRSGYIYHGRIKSLADGVREGGVQI